MPGLIDQTGRKVGRWLVLHRVKDNPERRDRRVWWLCRCECGVEKLIPANVLNDGRSKSCGCLKLDLLRSEVGDRNRSWKGGRQVTDQGYVMVLYPQHHRAKKNGYVYEHILVMEKKIGRSLRKTEYVHHINGQRADNRPDNLELWLRTQPPGQRIEDLVRWAKEILATYEQEYTTFA